MPENGKHWKCKLCICFAPCLLMFQKFPLLFFCIQLEIKQKQLYDCDLKKKKKKLPRYARAPNSERKFLITTGCNDKEKTYVCSCVKLMRRKNEPLFGQFSSPSPLESLSIDSLVRPPGTVTGRKVLRGGECCIQNPRRTQTPHIRLCLLGTFVSNYCYMFPGNNRSPNPTRLPHCKNSSVAFARAPGVRG